jgi:hypothetical protein
MIIMPLWNFTHLFCVKDQATQRVLLHGRSHNGLYLVPCPISSLGSSNHVAFSSVTASADLWHRRLGHPSSSIIESVIRFNNLARAPHPSLSLVCDPCHHAKVHQLPFNNSTNVTTSPLELVHSDVWGPADLQSHLFVILSTMLASWVTLVDSLGFIFLSANLTLRKLFICFKSMLSCFLTLKSITSNLTGAMSIVASLSSSPVRGSSTVSHAHTQLNRMASQSVNIGILLRLVSPF